MPSSLSLVAPLASLLTAVSLASLGCSDDEDAAPPAPACVPDRAAFDGSVGPLVARYCGSCHGDVPTFGASATLTRHEALVADGPGGRLVDRIVTRLGDGSMPPAGMPRLPAEDADAIARWASCGASEAADGGGLVASAPPMVAPGAAPPGLDHLDLRASEHPVPPDALDQYWCYVFDADLPADRFVRRFEMVYGEQRVLHHLILARDRDKKLKPGGFACNNGSGMPAGSQYLYAWAPGQTALEFPSGGLRVRPGDRFVVTIHYNNGSKLPDVRDSSGVRLHLGPAEGTEYGMFSVGSLNFSLPPHQKTSVTSQCKLKAPLTLLGGMPHMHLLGSEFESRIERGGASTPLVKLTGWQFESQFFYSFPASLAAGDVIATTCTYENTTDATVRFGEATHDEMCNNFVYATPPPDEAYCDEGVKAPSTEVAYTPGACLPPGAIASPPTVVGPWVQASAPYELSIGPVADGTWVLDSVEFGSTGGQTPLGALDFATSQVTARGQVSLAQGTLSFDVASRVLVALDSGKGVEQELLQSFSIPFDPASSALASQPVCPADAKPIDARWGVEGDQLLIAFTRTDVPGMTLFPLYRFRKP